MYLTCDVSSHNHLIDDGYMFLICRVTSHEHILKELCESMGGRVGWWATILPCLVSIGLVQVEI